jgi:hypothetical protein
MLMVYPESLKISLYNGEWVFSVSWKLNFKTLGIIELSNTLRGISSYGAILFNTQVSVIQFYNL